MSAVNTLYECKQVMADDLYREVGRAPQESGYAQVYESPGGIKVLTAITKRGDEHPGPGARLRVRIEGHDGRVLAESEDATVDWFEEALP